MKLKMSKHRFNMNADFADDSYTDLNDGRELYLTGTVTDEVVNQLIERIHDINSYDDYLTKLYGIQNCEYNPAPIKLYINSPGGDLLAGLALVNAIETSQTAIHAYNTSECSSAALLIFVACHKRIAYRSSMFMYHQLSSGAFGKLADMAENVDVCKQLQQLTDDVFVQYTKFTQEELDEINKYRKDFTMFYKDAVSKGLVDQMIIPARYTKDLDSLAETGVTVFHTEDSDDIDDMLSKVSDDELSALLKAYIDGREAKVAAES